MLQPSQIRCSISSSVMNQFKYKICVICLPHEDLIHTHVSHLIHSWALVHLMNLYVIRIGYVQISNKNTIHLMKGKHNYVEINQLITSSTGLRSHNLTLGAWSTPRLGPQNIHEGKKGSKHPQGQHSWSLSKRTGYILSPT